MPKADAFFATATGVCVYVDVGGRAVRVTFESLGAAGRVEGITDRATEQAILAATQAFEKHIALLEPLFEHVARELAARRGAHDPTYLPVGCEACHGVELLPAEDCAGGQAVCPDCGGIARVVPGGSYAEGDVPVFQELGRIVLRAGVRAVEAQRLAIDIERACAAGVESETFSNLVRRLPSLERLRPVFEAHPSRQRGMLTMLGTVLNATASKQRSGVMFAFNSPAVLQRARKR